MASSTRATFCPGTSFVHVQGPSTYESSVQSRNSFLALLITRHFNKAKTTRLAGIAIGDKVYAIDLTKCREQLAHLVFSRVERQIADENILHVDAPSLSYLMVG